MEHQNTKIAARNAAPGIGIVTTHKPITRPTLRLGDFLIRCNTRTDHGQSSRRGPRATP